MRLIILVNIGSYSIPLKKIKGNTHFRGSAFELETISKISLDRHLGSAITKGLAVRVCVEGGVLVDEIQSGEHRVDTRRKLLD